MTGETQLLIWKHFRHLYFSRMHKWMYRDDWKAKGRIRTKAMIDAEALTSRKGSVPF